MASLQQDDILNFIQADVKCQETQGQKNSPLTKAQRFSQAVQKSSHFFGVSLRSFQCELSDLSHQFDCGKHQWINISNSKVHPKENSITLSKNFRPIILNGSSNSIS